MMDYPLPIFGTMWSAHCREQRSSTAATRPDESYSSTVHRQERQPRDLQRVFVVFDVRCSMEQGFGQSVNLLHLLAVPAIGLSSRNAPE